MSRFDDEIRAASRQLAREPMPDGILDEPFELMPDRRRGAWLAGAAVGAVGLVMAVAWMAGRVGLPAAADGSPSGEPGPSAPVTDCHDLPPRNARSTEYRVFFPCADGSGLASATRVGPLPPGDDALLEWAIRDVLNGPNEPERAAGMTGVAAPASGSLLTGVALQPDGLAILHLSAQAADAELTPRVVDAVRATALDQDAVTAVEIRLAGDCGQFFALFGALCNHLAEPLALTTDCPVAAPGALPQGDSVGAGLTAPRPDPQEANVVHWGAEENTVTERIGSPGGTPFPLDGETVALPFLDGIASADRAEFTWIDNGCPYQVTLEGRSGAFAYDYSTLFGDGTVTAPTPGPQPDAPFGTASVEADGIRITLTLDREHTSFGGRVWAEVTVENVGPDVVRWGHSGTCDWPAGVHLTPNATLPEYGAQWPGEAGVLKRVIVDDADAWRFGFVPEAFVGFEGNWGCTSDLVPDEIQLGERLIDRFAWDTVGMNGMAPPGGRYVAESVFAYQGRGDEVGDEDPFGKRVNVRVSLDVEGPARDYLTPGEAMDALLADESFIRLLAENPRTQWNGSTLRWDDESWHLEIAQEEPFGSLVGRVDAITGAVSEVGVSPGN